jgi:hypothetical protein
VLGHVFAAAFDVVAIKRLEVDLAEAALDGKSVVFMPRL